MWLYLNPVKPFKVAETRTSGLVNLVLYRQAGFIRARAYVY